MSRIIHRKLNAAAQSGPHYQNLCARVFFYGIFYRIGDRGNHRGNDASGNVGDLDIMKFKGFPENRGVLQTGGFLIRPEALMEKQPVVQKTSDDNIGVADIDC